MLKETFKSPLDQGWYYVESRILAFIFAIICITFTSKILQYSIKGTNVGAGGVLLIVFALFVGLMGGGIFAVTMYHIRRGSWIPRLIIDALVVLVFYFFVIR